MASEKNLQELFHDTLKDIYFAEKKILTAFAKDGQGRSVPGP
jgi:ferritin-like metal-binding protein YciE